MIYACPRFGRDIINHYSGKEKKSRVGDPSRTEMCENSTFPLCKSKLYYQARWPMRVPERNPPSLSVPIACEALRVYPRVSYGGVAVHC